MKATVYDLGRGIGVCLLEARGNRAWVAEVDMETMRVLPQSVRPVEDVRLNLDLQIDDEATAQDRVDRSTLGLQRFRDRLGEFDPGWAEEAELSRWKEQLYAARDEIIGLIAKLSFEEDSWEEKRMDRR